MSLTIPGRQLLLNHLQPWLRTGFGPRRELSLILGVVHMTLRPEDQTVITDGPLLKADEINGAPGTAGPRVRPGPVPMKFHVVAFAPNFDRTDKHVWKCRHELASGLFDRGSTYRWFAVIDFE